MQVIGGADITADNTKYFEFTLTPNAGYEIDFVSFTFQGQRNSFIGPVVYVFRSSLDLFTANIGGTGAIFPATINPTIFLNTAAYQNISGPITFRLYAYFAAPTDPFSINNFTFNGTVDVAPPCTNVTKWEAGLWTDGFPTSDSYVIIADDYDTSVGSIDETSFPACGLTVSSTGSLTIGNNTFAEVQNDVVVDGTLTVETKANFVQYGNSFTVNPGGNAFVNKTTREYSDSELHYVYWSSPVVNADLSDFTNPYLNRRYYFDASLYLDEEETGTGNPIPDDIDDDNNDWQTASGPMVAGHGYVIATDNSAYPTTDPYSNTHQFTGELNTGDISVPVFKNDSFTGDTNWNLIGNPYPSAIDAVRFIGENYYSSSTNAGTIEGVIYLWSSDGVASVANPGFDTYNFSQTDYYELINLTGGTFTPPPPGLPYPIASGQGFFVSYHNDGESTSSVGDIAEGAVYFNNDMRIADDFSNSDFYKNSNVKSKTSSADNKLWVKLTSDNGVFNQILIGYVNMATDNYDGEAFDASKNLSSGAASILYTTIPDSAKKFAIQGKAETSLSENEVIKLGFDTRIDVPTIYTLSVAYLQGDFLSNNKVYLKDSLLNTLHDLSGSDYNFNSEVGEFKNRFEIVFTNKALSVNDVQINTKAFKIVELQDDLVQFNTNNNLTIKTVNVYDLLGRALYQFKGENTSETYRLSNLNNTVYIAKVALSDGTVVTKKAVKK